MNNTELREAIRKAIRENIYASGYESVLGVGAEVGGIDEATDAVLAALAEVQS